ncbi:MAG TPA: OPT/YSL family transporter, partial [Dongiaceae bacterium]|nr:OPT/YSL family transporter [Dongiaceae bacterium]
RDGLSWIPDQLELPVAIGRVSLAKLTLTLEPSLIFIGIGALFGMKVGMSMLLGVILNYGILAPHLINARVIRHAPPQVQALAAPKLPLSAAAGDTLNVALAEANAGPELASGMSARTLRYTWTGPVVYTDLAGLEHDLNAPALADGSPNPLYNVVSAGEIMSKKVGRKVLMLEAPAAIHWEAALSIPTNQPARIVEALGFNPGARNLREVGGFRNISAWSLWPGATVLVVGGLLALAFQWRTLGRTFGSIFASFGAKKKSAQGCLDDIEVPMSWFVIGFVLTGSVAAFLLVWLFSIHWYMGLLGVILSFFLAAVAARAGAETGINPIGALGKVTQLTYGAIAPGNIPANLMTAFVTGGAACSCCDTIGNLKVGHMVGANPRKQLAAQLFGVLAGALMAVPAYFILVPDANALGGAKFPAPSALVWMGVAKVLSQGLNTLPRSAVLAMLLAFVAGVVIVIIDRVFPKARPYTPSPTALGIALTIPGSTSFAMFLGALIVWFLERKAARWNELYTVPVASGGIAGESIMGVILALLTAAGLRH